MRHAHTPEQIRLSSAIMSHQRRRNTAAALAAHLRPSPPIIEDPEPNSTPNPLRTALHAWSALSPDATHHVVIQDDVIAPPELIHQVEAAARQHPDAALAFYANWNSINGDVTRVGALLQASWVSAVDDACTPALVLCLPRNAAEGFVTYGRSRMNDPKDPAHEDDTVMTDHLLASGIPTLISVPHLVDHDDTGSSLVGNTGQRRAAAFVTTSESDRWDPAGRVFADYDAYCTTFKLELWCYRSQTPDHQGRRRRWIRVNWQTLAAELGLNVDYLTETLHRGHRTPEWKELSRFHTGLPGLLWANTAMNTAIALRHGPRVDSGPLLAALAGPDRVLRAALASAGPGALPTEYDRDAVLAATDAVLTLARAAAAWSIADIKADR